MNKAKIEEVLKKLRENPERHDQGTWMWMPEGELKRDDTGLEYLPDARCKSTACLAGWTALIFAPAGTVFYKHYLREPGEALKGYEQYARVELELTYDEASDLFHAIDYPSVIDILETWERSQ